MRVFRDSDLIIPPAFLIMTSRGHKIFKVTTIVVVVVILLIAIYIMANGLGLVDSLDFGAGAYYYADIPGFEKFVRNDAYDSHLPLWLAIILFLLWGALMYWLWTKIDSHGDNDE